MGDAPRMSAADPVQEACRVLLCTRYCRKEAVRLARCTREGRRCEAEEAAFRTCSGMNGPNVVEALTRVASKNCPVEVTAFERCKEMRGEAACQAEDVAALMCAARCVLRS